MSTSCSIYNCGNDATDRVICKDSSLPLNLCKSCLNKRWKHEGHMIREVVPITDSPGVEQKRPCCINGCNEEILRIKLCADHELTWLKGNTKSISEFIDEYNMPRQVCDIYGCGKDRISLPLKGKYHFCEKHYNLYLERLGWNAYEEAFVKSFEPKNGGDKNGLCIPAYPSSPPFTWETHDQYVRKALQSLPDINISEAEAEEFPEDKTAFQNTVRQDNIDPKHLLKKAVRSINLAGLQLSQYAANHDLDKGERKLVRIYVSYLNHAADNIPKIL